MSNRKLLVILLPIFAVVLGLACSLVYVLSIGNEVICPDSSDGITGETSMDITEDQTSGEPPEEPSEILPQSIALSCSNTALFVGSRMEVIARILPLDTTDLSVSWESSDETVLRIEGAVSGGVSVLAVSEGRAEITAETRNGLSAVFEAEVIPENGLVFSEYNNGYSVTGFLGNQLQVVIPKNISGKPVLAIGREAFRNCQSLEDVTIPDSVTEIGESAFA